MVRFNEIDEGRVRGRDPITNETKPFHQLASGGVCAGDGLVDDVLQVVLATKSASIEERQPDQRELAVRLIRTQGRPLRTVEHTATL